MKILGVIVSALTIFAIFEAITLKALADSVSEFDFMFGDDNND